MPEQPDRVMYISPSIVRSFVKKDIDACTRQLQGWWDDDNQTEYMEIGSHYHNLFEMETMETGKVPQIFKRQHWEGVRPELKRHVRVSEWLMLVIKMDLVAPRQKMVVDYKIGCGEKCEYKPATSSADKYQGGIYLLGANAPQQEHETDDDYWPFKDGFDFFEVWRIHAGDIELDGQERTRSRLRQLASPKYLDDCLEMVTTAATDLRATLEANHIPWWRIKNKQQEALAL